MCFASICYHYKAFKEGYLHENCLVRYAYLCRGIPKDISLLTEVRYPWNKTADTPKSTDDPPHVLHLADMEKLQQQLKSLKTELLNEIKQEIDSRGFSSQEHNTDNIIELITTVTTQQT